MKEYKHDSVVVLRDGLEWGRYLSLISFFVLICALSLVVWVAY